MSHEATLSFTYESSALARRIERALRPESDDLGDERSSTRLVREGAVLTVTVAASDLVALRAGLNTWLSLVSVAEQAGGDGETQPKAGV